MSTNYMIKKRASLVCEICLRQTRISGEISYTIKKVGPEANFASHYIMAYFPIGIRVSKGAIIKFH